MKLAEVMEGSQGSGAARARFPNVGVCGAPPALNNGPPPGRGLRALCRWVGDALGQDMGATRRLRRGCTAEPDVTFHRAANTDRKLSRRLGTAPGEGGRS